jgi:hypothetical protein
MINNMNTDKFDSENTYKRGDEFPKVSPLPESSTGYFNWRKYFHGNNEFIEIPKNYDYMN